MNGAFHAHFSRLSHSLQPEQMEYRDIKKHKQIKDVEAISSKAIDNKCNELKMKNDIRWAYKAGAKWMRDELLKQLEEDGTK